MKTNSIRLPLLILSILMMLTLSDCKAPDTTEVPGSPESSGWTDTTAPDNITMSIQNDSVYDPSITVQFHSQWIDDLGAVFLSEDATADPVPSDGGWIDLRGVRSGTTTSTSFILSAGEGNKTVYAWLKDDAGNISSSISDSTTYAPFDLPDTGQTISYTDTVGEDHDYSINPPSFTDNSNDTITDNNTRLIWQKEDNNTTYSWPDAMTYCQDLILGSQDDWRLPDRRELMSIVNYEVYRPTIDEVYFPNTKSGYYWSSTICVDVTSYAWVMEFDFTGRSIDFYMANSIYVRCVRGRE